MQQVKPIETLEGFSVRLNRLHRLASRVAANTDTFQNAMDRAKAAGMSYCEALETVIRESAGGAD